ncbi:hypothetical protein [Halomicronema hongdechloris]|nr:hypothetical protein [Halomicronema hongdechloris]
MKEQLLRGLNWLLVLDFFLVLASFGWLVVAVIGRSFALDLGLRLWYSLWDPLFLPAISLLIGGAILSGVAGWISRKLSVFRDG